MIFRNFVEFDNIKYEYESGSWSRTLPIKRSRNTTQTQPSYQYDGLDKGSGKITLSLTTHNAIWGETTTGESQLSSLLSSLNKTGVSMPVTFVDPTGSTYSVVPDSPLQLSQSRIYGGSLTPIEFLASLSFDEA